MTSDDNIGPESKFVVHHNFKDRFLFSVAKIIIVSELYVLTIENAAEADRTIAMLMGDDVAPRREFIEENATYANIDA